MAKVQLFQSHLNEDVERPEGVRTVWQSVTPHWAEKQLDVYEKFCDENPTERKNRPVHQSQVNKYVQDMRAGMWGRNHQGIAFDRDGILMDGQHRLWAVVESGITVMMPVTWGLDREAQLTIDSGLKRTTADVAAIAGFIDVTPLHVGIVKAMVRGVAATKPSYTRLQEIALLREHEDAITYTLNLFPKKKIQGISRAPVLAAIARAYYTQDDAKVQRFAEVLKTGITSDEKEHVIITLRNWLMTTKSDGGTSALEAHGKTSRALQAYIRGEKIRILYAAKEDLFKLPVKGKK